MIGTLGRIVGGTAIASSETFTFGAFTCTSTYRYHFANGQVQFEQPTTTCN